MNQQQQIDIIKAHMAGKRVLLRHKSHEGQWSDWTPLHKGEYEFDFISFEYKIEPRKLELFMALPSGVLQALGRESSAVANAWVSNQPPSQLQPSHVIVKIRCTEPEN